MGEDDLKTGFEEIFKLCCLISTIPATTVSVERSFFALKRIKIFARSTQSQARMSSNLSLSSIEKELLNNLKSKLGFYDLVIKKNL